MSIGSELRTLPDDSKLRQVILEALSDDYSRSILNYTIEKTSLRG